MNIKLKLCCKNLALYGQNFLLLYPQRYISIFDIILLE